MNVSAIEAEVAFLRRRRFTSSPALLAGTFVKSARFLSWSEDQRYDYLERVGMIDGKGPAISPEAHVIACAQVLEPSYSPFHQT